LETETPTIVYFYDAVGWDHIYVWVWRGFDNPFPNWPGKEATPLEGEPGWYYIEVPYSLEFGSFGIVFHNNLTEQSGDYQVAEDKLYATKFGIYESMEAALLSLEEDEEPGDEEPTTSTIYFYNSLAWEEVYLWAWTTNGNLVENWPGI